MKSTMNTNSTPNKRIASLLFEVTVRKYSNNWPCPCINKVLLVSMFSENSFTAESCSAIMLPRVDITWDRSTMVDWIVSMASTRDWACLWSWTNKDSCSCESLSWNKGVLELKGLLKGSMVETLLGFLLVLDGVLLLRELDVAANGLELNTFCAPYRSFVSFCFFADVSMRLDVCYAYNHLFEHSKGTKNNLPLKSSCVYPTCPQRPFPYHASSSPSISQSPLHDEPRPWTPS